MDRRFRGRPALVALAVLALLVALPWWLFTGLLSGPDHSACADAFSADVAFVLSYVGLALALAALVEAFRTQRLRIGWALLGAYAVALAVSVGISITCAEDEGSNDKAGTLGGGDVKDISTLRACLKTAGARLTAPGERVRVPREGTWVFYDGKLPDGAEVKSVEGVGSARFRVYFAAEPGKETPGFETVLDHPERAAVVAYVYPERAHTVGAAEECLPRMRNVGL